MYDFLATDQTANPCGSYLITQPTTLPNDYGAMFNIDSQGTITVKSDQVSEIPDTENGLEAQLVTVTFKVTFGTISQSSLTAEIMLGACGWSFDVNEELFKHGASPITVMKEMEPFFQLDDVDPNEFIVFEQADQGGACSGTITLANELSPEQVDGIIFDSSHSLKILTQAQTGSEFNLNLRFTLQIGSLESKIEKVHSVPFLVESLWVPEIIKLDVQPLHSSALTHQVT